MENRKIMRTIRKIVLAGAALICAALVMVPLVSAAGPGQGFSPGGQMNQGQDNQISPGSGGMGQNTGSGNGAAPGGGPGNGQNSQDTGTGSPSFAGNETAPHEHHDHDFGNFSGNMTPPEPSGDLNLTAVGNTLFGQLPPDSNMTADNNWTIPFNATGPQPGGQNQPLPAGNLTAPNPAGGNTTPPLQQASPGGSNANNGGNQAGSGSGQAGSTSQDQKDSDLISAFLQWLKGGGSSAT